MSSYQQQLDHITRALCDLTNRVNAIEHPPEPTPTFNVNDYSGWPDALRYEMGNGVTCEERKKLADILDGAFAYIRHLEDQTDDTRPF